MRKGTSSFMRLSRAIVIMSLMLLIIVSSPVSIVLSESEPTFSFALMADIHYADRDDQPEVPRYYRTSLDNVREAVGILNEEQVDFMVVLGDSIMSSSNRNIALSNLKTLDAELSKFQGDLYYVLGNTDLRSLSREMFYENTSGAASQPNYFFDKEGYRFIAIDANWEPNYSIHEVIVDWLEDVIFEAKDKGLKVIVFVHQGLDNRNHSHVIQNAEDVRKIFESAGNVFAIFQGHTHAGGYWYINGIHYMGIQATLNHPDPIIVIADVLTDGSIRLNGYQGDVPTWSFTIE